MALSFLTTVVIAGLLGVSAISDVPANAEIQMGTPAASLELAHAEPTPVAEMDHALDERLSSREIDELLTSGSNLPPNCWVQWIMGQCGGIVCVENGFLVLYECEEFGY